MFGLKVPNRRKYIDFRPWRYSRCLAGKPTWIHQVVQLVTTLDILSFSYIIWIFVFIDSLYFYQIIFLNDVSYLSPFKFSFF